MFAIDDLPNTLLSTIFKPAYPEDRLIARLTCRRWKTFLDGRFPSDYTSEENLSPVDRIGLYAFCLDYDGILSLALEWGMAENLIYHDPPDIKIYGENCRLYGYRHGY